MTFKEETKIGLTYGQALSTLSLLALLIGGYVNLKTDVATLSVKAQENKERIERNEGAMKEFILENKVEHKEISNKLDKIINLKRK